MADFAPQKIKTQTAGDVQVDLTHYNGSTVGLANAIHVQPGTGAVFHVDDNSGTLTVDNGGTFAVQDSQVVADNAGFTDGTTKLFMAGYVFDETAGTALTENDAAAPRIDSKRATIGVLEDATTRGQRAAISAAGRLSVDASGVAVPVTDNSGSLTVDAPVGTPVAMRLSDGTAFLTTVGGSLLVDTELPAAVTLGDSLLNPTAPGIGGYNLGWTGSAWERVKSSSGRLQVDVITGGGGTTPTTPIVKAVASSAIAVSGSADIDADDVGSATKKLSRVIISSGGAIKAVVKKVANAVETIVGYIFIAAGGGTESWIPPHINYATQAPAGAGFDGFRVTAFNEDPQIALAVYATFFTEE